MEDVIITPMCYATPASYVMLTVHAYSLQVHSEMHSCMV